MINFPDAPTPGQIYTSGQASWAWDGGKWTAASGGSTAYAPLNAPVFTGDARAVTPATADNDTSIATTAYVQAQGYATSASVSTADNLRVLKAGDTMTGALTVTASAVSLVSRNLTNTAGYSEVARFNSANNAGATNYSELAIAQGATNAMVLEARDQAGAKGQLQLQPFGGSVLAPIVQVGTATTDAGGSGFTANNNGPKITYWGTGSAGAGALEFYAAGTKIMSVLTGGVVVGAGTSAAGRLDVRGVASAGSVVSLFAGGPTGTDSSTYLLNFADFAVATGIGGIARSGTNAVQYLTTSDGRLKEDIESSELGLDALMRIKVAEFRFPGDERPQQGVVAQELYDLYPDAVHAGGDDPKLDPWGVDYGRLTPLLIRTIQQQQGQIEALSAKVAALEAGG